jgi:hypothetical protein
MNIFPLGGKCVGAGEGEVLNGGLRVNGGKVCDSNGTFRGGVMGMGGGGLGLLFLIIPLTRETWGGCSSVMN